MGENREFLTLSGERENQKIVEEYETAVLENYEQEQSAELKALLDSVSFNTLQKVIGSIAERSGIAATELNFVDSHKILNRKQNDRKSLSSTGALYDPIGNCIGIDTSTLRQGAKNMKLDEKTFFLYLLCHEETHATAKVQCVGLDTNYTSIQFGYSHSSKSGDFYKDTFTALNEGITEKIGREAFTAYSEKIGTDQKEQEIFSKQLKKESEYGNLYGNEVSFVNVVIKKLSAVSGTPEKDVWDALKRGAYEGEDLRNEELKNFFEETFGEEFISDLANSKEGRHLGTLQKQIEVASPKGKKGFISQIFKGQSQKSLKTGT